MQGLLVRVRRSDQTATHTMTAHACKTHMHDGIASVAHRGTWQHVARLLQAYHGQSTHEENPGHITSVKAKLFISIEEITLLHPQFHKQTSSQLLQHK